MYSILVLQCGIDPGYVLDKMELYEIEALMDNLWMKDKESWEQSRLQAYVTAQVNSTKQMEMKDILTFPWEKITQKVEDTQEEKEAIMKEIQEWNKIMNKKNI